MKKRVPIPGMVKRFLERTGGYVNYLYDSQKLQKSKENTHESVYK